MSKVAFIFPGQGSQSVGMCKDLYENYACARRTFEEADEALGFSISKLCFEGPEDQLRLTFNTQPAILTASVACARVLAENGVTCEIAAGHSLGEYSALVQAEALDFADAVRIVRKRGQFMQEAVPVGEGSMAAVLGMDSDKIVEICRSVEAECGEAVQAVNFNCPGQVVPGCNCRCRWRSRQGSCCFERSRCKTRSSPAGKRSFPQHSAPACFRPSGRSI